MPLLLHNWRELVELWTAALDVADDEAMRALMECVYRPRVSLPILTSSKSTAEDGARPTNNALPSLPRSPIPSPQITTTHNIRPRSDSPAGDLVISVQIPVDTVYTPRFTRAELDRDTRYITEVQPGGTTCGR